MGERRKLRGLESAYVALTGTCLGRGTDMDGVTRSGQRLQGEMGGVREVVFFAAAPRLDSLKTTLVFSFSENLNVLVIDVQKAHLNWVVKLGDGNHSVQAPAERKKPGKCWKLNKWLYSMRPAAMAWEEDYATKTSLWRGRWKESKK